MNNRIGYINENYLQEDSDMHPRCQQATINGDRATLKNIKLPFDRVSKWELILGGARFGRYRTKAEAVADAKKYDLKIT